MPVRIFLWCLIQVVATLPATTQTVVRGTVTQYAGVLEYPRLRFATPSLTTFKFRDHYTSIEENGNYQLTLDLLLPTEMWLILPDTSIYFLLVPGENLQLNLDLKDGKTVMKWKNEQQRKRQQQYELLQSDWSKAFPEDDLREMARTTGSDAFKRYAFGRQGTQLDWWQQWKTQHAPVDPLVEEWLLQQSKLGALQSLFHFSNLRKRYEDLQPEAFFDFWNELTERPTFGLHSFILARVKAAYLNYHNIYTIGSLPDSLRLKPTRSIPVVVDILKQQADDQAGSMILGLYLGNMLDFPRFAEGITAADIQAINWTPVRKQVMEKWNDLQAELNPAPGNNQLWIVPDSMREVLALASKRFPDKVIVIDIWATWCGSCVANMQNKIPPILDRYSPKDVVFLFVCCGSQPGNWQRTIGKLPFSAEHWLINDDQYKVLQVATGVQALPHYVILDRDGIIIERDAPWPGQGMERILDKLVNP